MCILIHARGEGARITLDTFKQCADDNPHGFGLMYADTHRVHIWKSVTSSPEELHDRYVQVHAQKADAVLHFRLATHGVRTDEQAHPYHPGDRTDIGVAHNGIMQSLVRLNLPDKDKSDTWHFTNHIMRHLHDGWQDDPFFVKFLADAIGSGNKVAVMDKTARVVILNRSAGTEDEGNWYSNTGYRYKRSTPQFNRNPGYAAAQYAHGFDGDGDEDYGYAGYSRGYRRQLPASTPTATTPTKPHSTEFAMMPNEPHAYSASGALLCPVCYALYVAGTPRQDSLTYGFSAEEVTPFRDQPEAACEACERDCGTVATNFYKYWTAPHRWMPSVVQRFLDATNRVLADKAGPTLDTGKRRVYTGKKRGRKAMKKMASKPIPKRPAAPPPPTVGHSPALSAPIVVSPPDFVGYAARGVGEEAKVYCLTCGPLKLAAPNDALRILPGSRGMDMPCVNCNRSLSTVVADRVSAAAERRALSVLLPPAPSAPADPSDTSETPTPASTDTPNA